VPTTQTFNSDALGWFTGAAANLLAVAVTLLALLPIAAELIGSRNPALSGVLKDSRKVQRALDFLLLSVFAFAAALLCGLANTLVRRRWLLGLQGASIAGGLLLAVTGICLVSSLFRNTSRRQPKS
jgi:small neutral amino acid transporter SnatA (MarC family)